MILLICDHKKRELKTLKTLKAVLKKKGIRSTIINKHCAVKAYNFYKPKIIIFPHSTGYLTNPIKLLKNKANIVMIPTEHCSFLNNLIEPLFFAKVKSHKIQNSFNLLNYVFVQSNFIKKIILKKSKLLPNQIISSGHLFYNNWTNNFKIKKNKIKKIGIALTNEFILRRYKNKNLLKNLHDLNFDIDLVSNDWRMKQINFDQYYFCLLFSIIKKLSKNYEISLKKHVVDVETNFSFLKEYNVKIDDKLDTKNWISKQDLIISTVSFINIDAYVYKKPHVSLMKLISKKFFFEAYGILNFKDYYEPNSFKPKSINELEKNIQKYKFKKNNLLDKKLIKYYSYPYKKLPIEIILDNLSNIYDKSNYPFKPVFTQNENKFKKIFGKKITFFISYLISQTKLFFDKDSKNSYFDFWFFFR